MRALSSECNLTKLALQTGCPSYHLTSDEISPNPEAFSANTLSLYQYRITEKTFPLNFANCVALLYACANPSHDLTCP